MPKCSIIDPLMTQYVDGELQGPDRQTVEQHLGVCPPCRKRVVAEQAVRDLLHARKPSLHGECAPPVLRATCAKLAAQRMSGADGRMSLAQHFRLRSRESPARFGETRQTAGLRAALFAQARRLEPLVLAATLILIVGGAFIYRLTDSSPRVMAAELTADHLKCFAMNAVLRTHHSPAAVQREMASRFDWDVDLPANPERAGLELVGARPCLYGEGAVAHIMYRHNGRPVSLFMLPRTAKSEQLVEVLGHDAAIWSVGDRTFVLIAREARSEVERMATFVHAALQSH